MQDSEIRRQLLKETRSAKKALKVAMNVESGIQNQLQLSGTAIHQNTNEITTTSINNIQNIWNRSWPVTSDFTKPRICPNCGYGWSAAHRQNCPARGKNSKNFGNANHFAKVCRKSIQQLKPRPRVNSVDDTISEAARVGTPASVGEQVDHFDRLLKKSIYDANYDSDYDDFDDICVATISTNDNIREVEPVNVNICIGNTNTKALVNSGSVCTIINRSLTKAVVSDFQESFWLQSPKMHELKTFSNDLIKAIGVIKTSVKCNNWVATDVNVTVVEDSRRPKIGRDIFSTIKTLTHSD